MKNYTVYLNAWTEGQGYNYRTEVKNVHETFTPEQLGEFWGEYCESIGWELELVDDETNETIAKYTRE